jgi:hypothetical protein
MILEPGTPTPRNAVYGAIVPSATLMGEASLA